ncbi:hypothetical protein GCM10010211_26270 [Streptomyces albospinus]|uniref:DUF4328 domain-containing protein n=1 Tax=Streptomyces albospinus TaxID=285515 RepID=A0ABQ2UY98_9ACTN|nr:DUF4328 domain-containing protein [Streptomyces albospinus]GGU59990.1 hypothetical protein GCM10010211_26270 [Streptomyces albospinus]
MNDDIKQPALRPVRGVARCAIAGLTLAGAAWAAQAVWQVRLALVGMPPSGPPDQGGGQHRPLTGLEDAYHVVSALGGAATLLCAAAFLVWLLRMGDNARALSGQAPRYAWPWVYVGWIVPVMNLWVPRGIVVDVHQKSAPGERLPRAVNWWWGLWLAGMLSGVGLMYTGSTDDIIKRAYTNVQFLVMADAAIVGAAVAGIFVVRALTAVQQERMDAAGR